jgi:RimJ/RimL family protein N-acetyltransferase
LEDLGLPSELPNDLRNAEPFASTERLILRGFLPEDFEAYSAYRFLPVIYRFLYRDPPSAQALRERFDASLNSHFSEDGGSLRWAVLRREDGVLLGGRMAFS